MKGIKKRKKKVDEIEQVEDDHLAGSSVCFPLFRYSYKKIKSILRKFPKYHLLFLVVLTNYL